MRCRRWWTTGWPSPSWRPQVIAKRIQKLSLRIQPGVDFELVNPHHDPRFKEYWQLYHGIMKRRGVTPDAAKAVVRTRNTVIAALMVRREEADAMICGVVGRYQRKLGHVLDVLGLREDVKSPSALSAISIERGVYFICDTYVNPDPTAAEIAETTMLAAEQVRRFGITPKVALLSHSSFGSSASPSAVKMREALQLLKQYDPELEVEGEMHADAALSEEVRDRIFPDSLLRGSANLFIMPTLDAANIAFNMIRVLDEGVAIGPILMGANYPAHVLTPSSTVRRVVNMSAVAAVDAQKRREENGSQSRMF